MGVKIEQVLGSAHEEKRFLAFVETWERKCIDTKDSTSEILLKRKYAGLRLYDIDGTLGAPDPLQAYVIDPFNVKWFGSKEYMCWCVLVRKDEEVTEDNKDNWKAFVINHDLHFAIRTFHRKNPGQSIR